MVRNSFIHLLDGRLGNGEPGWVSEEVDLRVLFENVHLLSAHENDGSRQPPVTRRASSFGIGALIVRRKENVARATVQGNYIISCASSRRGTLERQHLVPVFCLPSAFLVPTFDVVLLEARIIRVLDRFTKGVKVIQCGDESLQCR